MDRLLVAAVKVESLTLEGLKRVFSRSPFRIARTSDALDELLKDAPCDRDHFDFLLLSADVLSSEADDDIRQLRGAYPKARVVLLAHSRADCGAAIAHVDGLILTHSSAAVIVKTLELIALGERVLPGMNGDDSPRPRRSQPSGPPRNEPTRIETLSVREAEVFRHLAEGSPNKVIARHLGLSEATVKMHVKSILRKTGSRNRTEAALLKNSLQNIQMRPN